MRKIIKRLPLFCNVSLSITIAIATVSSNVQAAEKLRIGGSGTDIATMRLLTEKFSSTEKDLEIIIPLSLGSSGGVRALRAGKLDIAITSRALKPKERSPTIRAFKYAQTALVFATAVSNPVDDINTLQLKRIYSGDHPYWPNGSVARPILRPASDSDTMLVKQRLPEMIESLKLANNRRGIPIATTDQDSATKIESVPGAIGTSTLSLILSENRSLKALKLNGISPSIETIDNGQYTLVKELFLIVPSEPNDIVRKFILFMNSQAGTLILKRTGHKAIKFSL